MPSFDSIQFNIPSSFSGDYGYDRVSNEVWPAGDIDADGLEDFVSFQQDSDPDLETGGRKPLYRSINGREVFSDRIVSFEDDGVDIASSDFPDEPRSIAAFDINGDGIDDFAQAVSSREARELGFGWQSLLVIAFGRKTGPIAPIEELNGENGYIIGSDDAFPSDEDEFVEYYIVENANGDEFPDILINATATYSGMAFYTTTWSYLLFGGPTLARADAADGAADGRIAILNAVHLDDTGESYVARDDGPIFGGAGEDRIKAGAAPLTAEAGDGDDVVVGRDADDRIDLGPGDDRAVAGAGDDTVSGRQGRDVIKTGDGDDVVDGGSGDDLILSGPGNDSVRGGGGDGGDDVVKAGDGDDSVYGLDGDDRLAGWRGADILDGGAGDDVLLGQIGDDLLIGGPGRDRLVGGPGRDVFLVRADGGQDRIVDFRPGSDIIAVVKGPGLGGAADLDIRTSGSRVVIGLGAAGGEIVVAGPPSGLSVDALLSGGLRFVTETAADDSQANLRLGDGDDVATAGGRINSVFAGAGDDVIFGGQSSDMLRGEDGDDRLYANGGSRDTLDGGAGDDLLFGGDGKDSLIGGDGCDRLQGAAGGDRLLGGDGDDLLEGGSGNDVLDGGPGSDVFVFRPGFGHDNKADYRDTTPPPAFEIGLDMLRFIGVDDETLLADYSDDYLRTRTIVELTTEAGDSVRFTLGFGERLGDDDMAFL